MCCSLSRRVGGRFEYPGFSGVFIENCYLRCFVELLYNFLRFLYVSGSLQFCFLAFVWGIYEVCLVDPFIRKSFLYFRFFLALVIILCFIDYIL
jgi:hypothetical protein